MNAGMTNFSERYLIIVLLLGCQIQMALVGAQDHQFSI